MKRTIGSERHLSNALLLALLMWVPVVLAQHFEALRRPAALMQFSIAALPMDRALEEFATQSGLQMVFVSDDIASGMRAQAVSGLLSPEGALAQLLAHSCLGYRFVNKNTVAIEGRRAPCQ
jgi:hypothetical protein